MTANRRFTVLVVDDEPGMRETLVDILEAAGYEVRTAGNGDDALIEARGSAVDLMVMDVQMPKRDGVSVLEELRPPPPMVIMMTAYAIEERLKAAVDADAFAILHKPFAVQRLLSVVASATETVA